MLNARRSIIASLFLAIGTFVAAPARAEGNRILNPGFDEGLSEWDNPNNRPGDWDPRDFAGNPDSGSALLTHDGVSNNAVPGVLEQCHQVEPSTEYTFGHQVFVPPGQPENTEGSMFAITYADENCPGSGSLQIKNAQAGEVGEWVTVSNTLVTDPDTRSLEIRLGVWKPGGEDAPAAAYLDNIFLYETESGTYRLIDELLAGAWYNPMWPGQGIFLDINREINLFFGGWFAWTRTLGEIFWWTVQGGFNGGVATVKIYRSSGGALNDPAMVENVAVGMGEFRFFSCTEGEFRYRFDGDSEYTVIPLSRLAPAFHGCED